MRGPSSSYNSLRMLKIEDGVINFRASNFQFLLLFATKRLYDVPHKFEWISFSVELFLYRLFTLHSLFQRELSVRRNFWTRRRSIVKISRENKFRMQNTEDGELSFLIFASTRTRELWNISHFTGNLNYQVNRSRQSSRNFRLRWAWIKYPSFFDEPVASDIFRHRDISFF